ncbi:hypothetical protein FRC04_005893 [Tulasnella sp. 424]|nr:hypothetical protein FRC04_005893 [Tulasnella sp. 424]
MMNHLPQATPSDSGVKSGRLPQLILSAATAPDARSVVVAHSDVLRESGCSVDQVMDQIRRIRKKACVSTGDKITFVLEFVLQGMGTNPQITKAVIDEFYDDKPTDDHVKQLKYLIPSLRHTKEDNRKHLVKLPSVQTRAKSSKIEADTDLPQSLLGTVHNAHSLAPTPVFSSPWTDATRTLCSSPSFTDTRSAVKGKLLQLPLLSPALTSTTVAEHNATPAASPSIFSLFPETSPISRLDQYKEWNEALTPDFDRVVESHPGSPSLPCTAPTLQQISMLQDPASALGLGMDIPLDELSRFDDPSLTMPDFQRGNEGYGFLNHPAMYEEGAVPNLQPDKWLHGSSSSSLVEGTQKSDGPTSLDPSQLLTFDQIMSLILGEPPIDPSSSETVELGNPLSTPPPYPGQTITPGNLREETEAEADFAEYLKTWFMPD